MRMKTLPACVVLLAAAAHAGRATETFSGTTAAHVDWSVRACEFKSGDKTRTLVEQAKASSESRFSDLYVKAYASKDLTDANASTAATAKFCEKILEWYGPAGSRIAGLVAKATETLPPASSTPPTKSDSGKGRRKRGM